MLNEQLGVGENVAAGLVEHKAERAHVDTVPAAFAGVQKFHVAVLIQPELQSLRDVVHFCRNYGVGHLQLFGKLLIDVEQRGSLGEALGHVDVLTAYLKHSYWCFVLQR